MWPSEPSGPASGSRHPRALGDWTVWSRGPLGRASDEDIAHQHQGTRLSRPRLPPQGLPGGHRAPGPGSGPRGSTAWKPHRGEAEVFEGR